MYLNLGDTQATVTGSALIPLTLTVSNSVGTLAAFGSTYCTAASGNNPCPNINFMASPPMWQSPTPVSMTMGSTVLNAACNAPSTAPSPAPGFTPGCFVAAYEGGGGPYLVQGPATGPSGKLSVAAQTSTLNFNPLEAYNFFLMYVTAISSPPPPMTPSPAPSPTDFATQPPPATPTPLASLSPSPCPSVTSDGDEGVCGTPTPAPTPTACDDDGEGHHHHHHHHHHKRRHSSHRGDDDCEDS